MTRKSMGEVVLLAAAMMLMGLSTASATVITDQLKNTSLFADNDGILTMTDSYSNDPLDPGNANVASRWDKENGWKVFGYAAAANSYFDTVDLSFVVWHPVGDASDYGTLLMYDAVWQPMNYTKTYVSQESAGSPFAWYTVNVANGGIGSGRDLRHVYIALSEGESWSIKVGTVKLNQVPEPATLALLAIGGLMASRKRQIL